MAVGDAGAAGLWALPSFTAKGRKRPFALSYIRKELNVNGSKNEKNRRRVSTSATPPQNARAVKLLRSCFFQIGALHTHTSVGDAGAAGVASP